MKLTNDLIVIDLETTGTWVEKDKIVEIAMIKCHVNGDKEIYHKRVNPGISIPKNVSKLIGISDDDVKELPNFQTISAEVVSFIGESDLAGYNSDKFDLPLLERELCDSGLKFNWRLRRTFDAQKVYHINEKRDLTAAFKFYCQKKLENAHSALADAEATLSILNIQVDKYCDENGGMEQLGKFAYQEPEEFFDADRRFRWWDGKLYMMFGKYSGKYSLQEIVKKDRQYLQWILSADFSGEVKALVEDAIIGKFPVRDLERNGQRELF